MCRSINFPIPRSFRICSYALCSEQPSLARRAFWVWEIKEPLVAHSKSLLLITNAKSLYEVLKTAIGLQDEIRWDCEPLMGFIMCACTLSNNVVYNYEVRSNSILLKWKSYLRQL